MRSSATCRRKRSVGPGYVFDEEERRSERHRRLLAAAGPKETSERIQAYHANSRRNMEVSAEKERLWDEQDAKLFAEAKTSMFKMAEELLDPLECPCEVCARHGQQYRKKK